MSFDNKNSNKPAKPRIFITTRHFRRLVGVWLITATDRNGPQRTTTDRKWTKCK